MAVVNKQFFLSVPNIIRKAYCERASQGEIRRWGLITAPALQILSFQLHDLFLKQDSSREEELSNTFSGNRWRTGIIM